MKKQLESLVVRLEADIDEFRVAMKKGTATLNRSARQMERRLDQLQRRFKLFAAATAAAFTAATVASIRVASDIDEMQSKFRVVFGASAKDVETWAAGFAAEVGRSRFAIQEFAATVQDTFVPLGFARGEAAEMSKTVAQLAVDLASFNNASESETIQLLTSALVGNHEAVRRFGIVITQATLKAELLRMGIAGGTQAATEQQKAMARLNLILANSSDAQGDAARTSDQHANLVRALGAEVRELANNWGELWLPVADKVIVALTSMVDLTEKLLPDLAELREGAQAWLSIFDQSRAPLAVVERTAEILREQIAGLEQGRRLGVGLKGMFNSDAALVRKKRQLAELELQIAVARERAADATPAAPEPAAETPEDKTPGKIAAIVAALELEREQLGRTSAGRRIYKELLAKGIEVTEENVTAILPAIVALEQEKSRLDEANRARKEGRQITESVRTATERYQAEIEKLNELQEAGTISQVTYNRALAEAAERLEGADERMADLKDAAGQMARGIGNAFTRMSDDARGFEGVLRSVGETAFNIIQQLLIQKPLEKAFGALFAGALPGLFGGGGAPQPKAGGGTVAPRAPILVGERGPELFAPAVAGRIVPSHPARSMMGGITINNIVDARGADVAAIRRLEQGLAALARSQRGIAIAAVADERLRTV